jgi:hypothetical protein
MIAVILIIVIWSFLATQDVYFLNNYTCEDLDTALMKGICVPMSCNWMTCKCYAHDDVYIHYKFRCEEGFTNNLSIEICVAFGMSIEECHKDTIEWLLSYYLNETNQT